MEKIFTARQLADYLNVHLHSVHNWDRNGILKSHRTPTNRRYYTESQITEFLKRKESQS